MKTTAWTWLGILTIGGLAVSACSSDPDPSTTGGGGSGATGGTTTTTTTTATTTSTTVTTTSTGGGGPMGVCGEDLFYDTTPSEPGVFDGCLTAYCCDTFDPCVADAACAACLGQPDGAGCDTNTLFQAYQGCFDANCNIAICGTELATGSPAINSCINESCCTTFEPCEADAACNACLQGTGTDCENNALFTDYTACRDTACITDICGAPIQYITTYPNEAQDIGLEANACATANCCTDMDACADPGMDGYVENDPDAAACLACLAMDSSCPGGAIEAAATAFTGCVETNCGE